MQIVRRPAGYVLIAMNMTKSGEVGRLPTTPRKLNFVTDVFLDVMNYHGASA